MRERVWLLIFIIAISIIYYIYNIQTGISIEKHDIITTSNVIIASDLIVDVNTASEKELVKLPGIGPVLAERIISYRKNVAHFSKADDLNKVKGIGNKLVAKLRDKLNFGSENK